MYLSVTASPGVRGFTITAVDKILAVHLYAKSSYMALVARGSEYLIYDDQLKKTAWLLSRLMDRIGKETKSRYYTYTGPLEVRTSGLWYKPYISPTSTAEVVIRGRWAKVSAGDWKKKFAAGLDVEAVLKEWIRKLQEDEETRLVDQ
ncbi:MAG: hypothetical protein ABWK05_00090 [Pyrobaculum sp.]